MRIVNQSERLTEQGLKKALVGKPVQILLKIRISDCLPVDGSGISDELFRFALQAHFDCVVVDERSHTAILVVEFDGPMHVGQIQQARDAKKDELLRFFQVDFIRINSSDLAPDLNGVDQFTTKVRNWAARHNWADDHNRCPLCGSGLRRKKGRFGPFMSCVTFPICKGSRDVLPPSPPPPPPLPKTRNAGEASSEQNGSRDRHSSYSLPPSGTPRDTQTRNPRKSYFDKHFSPDVWKGAAIAGAFILVCVLIFVVVSGSRRNRDVSQGASLGQPPQSNTPVTPTAKAKEAIEQKTSSPPILRMKDLLNDPKTVGQNEPKKSEPASEAQMRFLDSIIKRKGWAVERRDSEAEMVLGYKRKFMELSKQEASKLITAWDDRKK